MERPDKPSQPPPNQAASGEKPREPATWQRHDRLVREVLEPSDMRSEPQPEEPGYGHGV